MAAEKSLFEVEIRAAPSGKTKSSAPVPFGAVPPQFAASVQLFVVEAPVHVKVAAAAIFGVTKKNATLTTAKTNINSIICRIRDIKNIYYIYFINIKKHTISQTHPPKSQAPDILLILSNHPISIKKIN